jgi:hypothetical protein
MIDLIGLVNKISKVALFPLLLALLAFSNIQAANAPSFSTMGGVKKCGRTVHRPYFQREVLLRSWRVRVGV